MTAHNTSFAKVGRRSSRLALGMLVSSCILGLKKFDSNIEGPSSGFSNIQPSQSPEPLAVIHSSGTLWR